MTSLLEERYRDTLRLLPAAYREQWGEDMVATFMQAAYAAAPDDREGVELGRPSLPEIASIAWLAIRLRLGATGANPRAIAWGSATRTVAVAGLFAQAATAVGFVTGDIWTYLHRSQEDTAFLQMVGIDATAAVARNSLLLVWLFAFLAVVLNRPRWAAALGLAGLVDHIAHLVAQPTPDLATAGYWTATFLTGALPVAALAAFHSEAAPVRRPARWMAGLSAAAAIFVVVYLDASRAATMPLISPATVWCLALTGALAAHLSRRRLDLPTGGAPAPLAATRLAATPLALAILALALLGEQVAELLQLIGQDFPIPGLATALAVECAQISCLAMVAVTAILAGRRALRQLPSAAAASSSIGSAQ